MSKFNSTKSAPVADTVTHEGGEAFSQSAERALAAFATTSFIEDTFYEGASDGINRVKGLISQVDPKFAAQAALYARHNANLRSVSHVIAGEVATSVKGEEWTKRFFDRVVVRPDDMTEVISYLIANNGKTIPNSVKKGFSSAFGRFDEYRLGKYRGEGKEVSLVDVVNLIHPRPTAKNGDALKKLVEGTLRNKSTWNAKLSEAGKTGGDKSVVWADFLSDPKKVEYFALLKNLRNIEQQAPDLVGVAAQVIRDENRIRNSRVLPFRFITAMKEFSSRVLQNALSDALDISVSNIPEFENALVVVDTSGSMMSPVAGSEKIACVELGSVFGAALAAKSNADIIAFASEAAYVDYRPRDSVLTNSERVQRTNVGYSTELDKVFRIAGKAYDNIIIFSDMQVFGSTSWGGRDSVASLRDYKKRTGANPNVFSFDLMGYGTSQFPESGKLFEISGYSDKVLSLMGKLAQDKDALVNEIKAIEI